MASAGKSWNSEFTDCSVRRCRELERDGKPTGVWVQDKEGSPCENLQVDNQLVRTTEPGSGAKNISKARPDQLPPSAHQYREKLGLLLLSTREDPEANESKICLPPTTRNLSPNSHVQPDIIWRGQEGGGRAQKKRLSIEKERGRWVILENIDIAHTGQSVTISLFGGVGTCAKDQDSYMK